MRPTEEYLRLEAYRPVVIREGEKIIELPAIQAVFRAMGCGPACKKDPVSGVIGVKEGPLISMV